MTGGVRSASDARGQPREVRSSRTGRRFAAPVALAAVCLVAVRAIAAEPVAPPPVSVELSVRLEVGRRALAGTERVEVVNSTVAPLDRIDFWLYANRFADRSPLLDDVNFYWVYPERFDPGFMRLSTVRVDGRDAGFHDAPQPHAGRQTLVEVSLAAPLAPGAHAIVEVAFATAIPERFGGFGCTGDTCTLFGGFYPMLASQSIGGTAGWDLLAPPARAHFTGNLVLDAPADLDTVIAGHHAKGPIVPFDVPDAPFLSIAVAPIWHPVERAHGGVTLVYLAQDKPPPADDAAHQIVPYTMEDRSRMVLDSAERALDTLAAAGAPVPDGTRLTLVAVPLRLELALAEPGMVAVSDRLFEVLPAERARKFHEREVVRAIFTSVLAARDVGLPPRERDSAPEAAAAYLTDVYTLSAWAKSETGQEILSPMAFVPEIDALIYAPQIAFADAYFGGVGDPDKFRDDPRRFASLRQRGSLLYEKLRDLLSADDLAKVIRRLIVDGQSVPAAAEGVGEAFFRQWGGAYPPVDYRFGPLRKWREGGRLAAWITLEKIVPPGSGAGPVEPVEVLAVDGDGESHDLKWNGAGERGVVNFASKVITLARSRSIPVDAWSRPFPTVRTMTRASTIASRRA